MTQLSSIRLSPFKLAVRRFSAAAAAGSLLCGMPLAPALAQSTPDATEPAAVATPTEAADNAAIEEIIVTAQKRAQSINDVGMSITALSGDQLREEGIRDVGDLTKVEPSFVVSRAAYGTPVYSIRGVGYNEQSLAASPTVSVYVDEVPYAYPALTKGAVLDLARVEVLKGPQGTLFGQNATGGAINYIAAKPTDNYESGVEFTYASFDAINLNGFMSGPLSDSVRARLAFDMSDGGAWQKSYTHGGELGKTDNKKARLLLDWQATDDLRFALNLNGWSDRSDAIASQLINFNPQVPSVVDEIPQAAVYPLSPRDNRSADWDGEFPPFRDESFVQAALRTEYVVSDTLDLTAITSFAKYSQDNQIENDGMSLDSNAERQRGNVKSFAQEVRLAGQAIDDRLNWLVGLAYSKDETKENSTGILPDSTSAHQPEPTTPDGVDPNFSTIGIRAEPTVENQAVFVNLDYEVSDALTVHGGARYTETDSQYVGCLSGDDNFTALFRPFNPALAAGDCVTVNNFVPGVQNLALKEDNVSWRVGADWSAAERTLVYATISKGFKSGSFPTLPATGVSQLLPATQESLLAYELGIKTELLDRKLALNGAVFYYDYKDKQLRGRILDPSGLFGVIDALVNVPKSEETGAELSATFRPTSSLTLNAAVTYLDSEVTGDFFTYDPFGTAPTNFNGYSFPTTPEVSTSVGARYEWSLASGQVASISADYRYQTESDGTFVAEGTAGEKLLEIDAYGLLDLRAGLESADGNWNVAVFGRNVTDEYYWTQATKVYDTTGRYAGMPRTVGITFGHRFSGT